MVHDYLTVAMTSSGCLPFFIGVVRPIQSGTPSLKNRQEFVLLLVAQLLAATALTRLQSATCASEI
ncbi:MAG TPA: hypothetical protein VFV82_08205, partial [Candidatus Binatia bacterium]|nr:hypothetical protein [Candidatus Binatia bacterium]